MVKGAKPGRAKGVPQPGRKPHRLWVPRNPPPEKTPMPSPPETTPTDLARWQQSVQQAADSLTLALAAVPGTGLWRDALATARGHLRHALIGSPRSIEPGSHRATVRRIPRSISDTWQAECTCAAPFPVRAKVMAAVVDAEEHEKAQPPPAPTAQPA